LFFGLALIRCLQDFSLSNELVLLILFPGLAYFLLKKKSEEIGLKE